VCRREVQREGRTYQFAPFIRSFETNRMDR
jgi:hypothetical protein